LKGFLKIVQSGAEYEITPDDLSAVAAHKQDFEVRPFPPCPFGQFTAVEVIGHHQVGQQQIHLVFALWPDLECFDSRGCLENAIPLNGEKVANQCTYGLLVFDNQNCF